MSPILDFAVLYQGEIKVSQTAANNFFAQVF